MNILAAVLLGLADEYSVETLKEAPPADVAEAVRKELAGEGVRILKDKKPFADYWLRKSVPTQAPSGQIGILYGMIRPGTLLAAVRVHAGSSDYRGFKVGAGAYTLRYGVQPEDGDHQGTAENRDFLILSPAAADPSPEVMKQDDVYKLSSKVTGKKHPAVAYVIKGVEGDKLPRLIHEEDKERWILECETSQAPNGKPLRLWIVVVGKAPE